MVTGLTSEMNIKQGLQCYTHYPFMSSDNWLNNTSFPFYKVDKSHKSRCYRHGLRHSFHSGICLAQQPAEHALGSQLSWGERREECRKVRGKQRRETEREATPAPCRAVWQSCLPRWSRAEGLPLPTGALPLLLARGSREVPERSLAWKCALPYQLLTATSFKKTRSVSNTYKWTVLIYFPHDYTHFRLQTQIKL